MGLLLRGGLGWTLDTGWLLRGWGKGVHVFSAAVEVRIKAAVALSRNLYDFIVNFGKF